MSIARAGCDATEMRVSPIGHKAAGEHDGADVDLAQEAVEMVNAKAAMKANVQVMKTADELTGVLLDILA